jgi:hypothetical protein
MRSKHHLSRSVAVIAAALFIVLYVSAAPVAAGFTFVAIPDIQNETDSYPAAIQSDVTWILNNRVSQNIAFACQEGDLTNSCQSWEFTVAGNALFQLSGTNGVPWSTCAGNHDMSGGAATLYNSYFGAANFAGKSWYGGATSDAMGNYQTFQAEGRNYLVLNIGYDASLSVRNWAQGVINTHPNMPTIINTHDYLDQGPPEPLSRSTYGNTLFSGSVTGNANGLVNGNNQVFMVVCGHNWPSVTRTATNAFGKPVFELQADYQWSQYAAGGDGYMRLYKFDEANSKIHVVTYSPYDTNTPYLPNNTSGDPNTLISGLPQQYDQFDITMNFNDRLGVAVPEPSMLVLAGLAVAAMLGFGCRSRRAG